MKRTVHCVDLQTKETANNAFTQEDLQRDEFTLSDCRHSCPADIQPTLPTPAHNVMLEEMAAKEQVAPLTNLHTTTSDHTYSLVTSTELPDQWSELCDDTALFVTCLEPPEIARYFSDCSLESNVYSDAKADLEGEHTVDEVGVVTLNDLISFK